MRLGQIRWNNEITAAVFENGGVRPIPEYTMQGLIERSEKEEISLAALAAEHAASHFEKISPIIPIHPREVWACGCTYEMSASFRDAEHGTREGFYAYVYREPRPEVFFKGTARVCVGPNKPIGVRADSKFTAPEPELAVVLGGKGRILGFTIANDVSAWDIERENPLYLPQSKSYTACCALGPVIVTPDEFGDPYSKEVTCTVERGPVTLFKGSVNTSQLHRKLETLIEYLYRSNPVPAGSVLCTGTGIIVKEDAALQAGDVCKISIAGIGELSNPAAIV
ncbi:MAG TPA: fumarylacetoacetate hydrolase family protein [Bryobacteraceae bacterium]|nr:fumarylacetoacetate hydrolase family protein [Bryobacteraceae bacterium]